MLLKTGDLSLVLSMLTSGTWKIRSYHQLGVYAPYRTDGKRSL